MAPRRARTRRFKKSFNHFRPRRVSQLYAAAANLIDDGVASEREVSQTLGFSRSAFQRFQNEPPSQREQSDMDVLPMVITTFHRHRRRYGARRIAADMKLQGFPIGRERAAKLLQIAGLSAIQPKSFKPRTTESRHTLGYNANLLLEQPEPIGINELWVGDITYIPIVRKGFAYMATLMDRFSRRIIGWSVAMDMTEGLVIETLQKAIRNRQPGGSLIHHTDRGGQYAGKKYRAIIERSSMRQSMSRAGDCYDNAFMESCFGTIKTELQMTEYESYREALKELTE
ncbi:MAG: IS3 family transposase, partial [Rhodopirellula bahusiensis]